MPQISSFNYFASITSKLTVPTPHCFPCMPFIVYVNTSTNCVNTSADCIDISVDYVMNFANYAHTYDDYVNTFTNLVDALDTPTSNFFIPNSLFLTIITQRLARHLKF
jgi:hypothetical protein